MPYNRRNLPSTKTHRTADKRAAGGPPSRLRSHRKRASYDAQEANDRLLFLKGARFSLLMVT